MNVLRGLEDRVYAVAGGSGGIGQAVVRRLVACGARPVNLSVEPAPGLDDVPYVAVDIADAPATARALEDVAARHGRLDGLVNAAGITRDRTIMKMSDDEWRSVLDINLTGAFHLTRAAALIMSEHEGGSIVHVASVNGLRGKFGQANYSASKAGMITLVRTAARELGRRDIRVNAVAPGMILTPMTADLPPDAIADAKASAALQRLGEPDDIAGPVAFLLSDLARHVTGTVLVVDGGQTA